MPDRLQTYPVQFEGGLVTNISQLQQGIQMPGSASVLINFEPSIDGGYRRILGYSKYDSASVTGDGPMRGVFYFGGAAYAVRDEHVYVSGGSGWTQVTDSSTYSSTGTTLDDVTSIVRFEKFNYDGNNTMIIVDGTNYPWRLKSSVFEELDPTSFTSMSTDAQGASHVINFKNHLMLGVGNNLVFSAPFDEEDFSPASGGGSINIGDAITGLKLFREQLVIFTERSIFILAGNTIADFQLQPVTRDLGCVEPDTIQEIGGDVLFLAPDGLRLLSGTERNNDFGLATISRVIQQEFLDLLGASTSFCSVVLREKAQYRIFGYALTGSVETGPGIIAVQKSAQGGANIEFAQTSGIVARVAYSDFVEGAEVILFANSDGYVYNMEEGASFDGSDITATFKTPFFSITDPSVRKQLHKVHLFTDPSGTVEADLSVRYDFEKQDVIQPPAIELSNTASTVSIYGRPGVTYGSGTYGGSLEKLFEVNTVGSGDVVALQFSSTGQNPSYSLDAVTLQYLTSGRR